MTNVFVFGAFNVLHPGHLRFLKFAKERGDHLIVGVLSDRMAGSAAHIPQNYRIEAIESNSLVDEVILIDESIEAVIEKIKPSIVVKGKEFETKSNPELGAIKKYGGRLVFSSGEALFSSLDLIKNEFNSYLDHSIRSPKDFIENHNITQDRLINLIKNFSKIRVCIIGDLIVDEYITCEPLGMSQEDPTLVVSPISSMKFIGGAGIVAAHAAGVGAKVTFISASGDDSNKNFAELELKKANVNFNIFSDSERPTTHKQRFRSQGKTLLRVSHLHQGNLSLEIQDLICKEFSNISKETDLLVFSDFNYGCLPQDLVNRLTLIAKENSILCAADSQSSSQVGNIGRFLNMDLITPTEREARLSTRDFETGLVVLAEKLRIESNANNIILKLGGEGALIQTAFSIKSPWVTDRLPALNSSPKDVAGAGDSLLITASLCLALKATIWESALIGSIAAAIQVSRLGNIQLQSDELLREVYGFRN